MDFPAPYAQTVNESGGGEMLDLLAVTSSRKVIFVVARMGAEVLRLTVSITEAPTERSDNGDHGFVL